MFRKLIIALPVAALVASGTTACASKKFVRTQVGDVNSKVDSLGRSVEETQERTRQNEGRITEVDGKATAAGQAAAQANTAAQQANSAAANAANMATAAGTKADTANARAEEVDKASKRLVYEVVLSEDQGQFKFNQAVLPDEAKARLDELITQMKADPKGAFFEIEGHTDNVGPTAVNEKIGMERAEAVKMYLYEHHQIPLHKINVISYGESKPVAPNNTRDGRAQNRRVVIRVLA
ncbi:MAG TPA: OmpA family protein [Vicinamibacterales bacterium]|jgi:outer membrane protein OmpA-like peptidoglycan-associated protein|nr:OmpA family protein [Vicinamibacterales bacterium]